ncbi:hypothetical protein TEA_006596 [Camellia sinensis var. sinensis]|uniref:ER lumen protein-retaining receptor n=1 Tax=Camellia sinensis var. sinensis TaxID=542762 RepID=A0A4S4ES70_CAMSN|nr:hypothetical protein TEA_006596 [Camellia sinensis var. sinensis]
MTTAPTALHPHTSAAKHPSSIYYDLNAILHYINVVGISLKTQELYALVFATRYLDIFTDYISLYNTVMKLIFLGSSFSIVWYIRHHKIVRRSYDKDQDTFRHYFLVLPCLFLALVINEKFNLKEVMWTFSLYLEAVAILPQLVLLQRTRNIDNLTGQYVFLLGNANQMVMKSSRNGWLVLFVPDSVVLSSCLLERENHNLGAGIDPSAACEWREKRDDGQKWGKRERRWVLRRERGRRREKNRAVRKGDEKRRDSEDDDEGTGLLVQCTEMMKAWISGLVQTLLYADFFYYYFQSWKNNVKLELPA